MKKLILIIAAFVISYITKAQKEGYSFLGPETDINDYGGRRLAPHEILPNGQFGEIVRPAEFPGKMKDYVYKNIIYPRKLRGTGLLANVNVKYTINKDGYTDTVMINDDDNRSSVTDIAHYYRDVNFSDYPEFLMEVTRGLKNMPQCIAGKKLFGRYVASGFYYLSITFDPRVSDSDYDPKKIAQRDAMAIAQRDSIASANALANARQKEISDSLKMVNDNKNRLDDLIKRFGKTNGTNLYNNDFELGMTKEMFLYVFGRPDHTTTMQGPNGITEIWMYGKTNTRKFLNLTFVKDKLVALNE